MNLPSKGSLIVLTPIVTPNSAHIFAVLRLIVVGLALLSRRSNAFIWDSVFWSNVVDHRPYSHRCTTILVENTSFFAFD